MQLPDFFWCQHKEPENLVNDGQDEKGKKEQPYYEI